MDKWVRRNERTIVRSLRRLMQSEHDTILAGYNKFMQAAMDHLIGVHAATEHHVHEDNTLAWAIIHNGEVVMVYGHKGGESVRWKTAPEYILRLVPSLPKEGWIGILLSGVKGWYNVEREMGYLTDTASWARDSFTKYFKPIA